MKTPPHDLLAAAKAVLPNAYAPYSQFHVAASVRTEQGKIFAGCNVENAAFPISICAETGAIAAAVANGHPKITEALIVVPNHKVCPPCGACRQRLLECASPAISIHLCTTHGHYHHTTLSELLPMAFGPNNLEQA